MPPSRRQFNNPDARPTTGGKHWRQADWRAEDRAQADANWERGRRRREVKRAGRPREVQPTRPRSSPPPDLVGRALAAGVSLRQVAHDLGISRFDLNRVLKQEKVRHAYDAGESNRRQLRTLLRQGAATQPPKHKLLSAAAEQLARALAAGDPPGQAAADLGVAPSTITRALQRATSPTAAEYLSTIRRGYGDGQERQRQCRTLLRRASAGG